jgi:hypothetical protein
MSDKALVQRLVELEDSDWSALLEEVWRERKKRETEPSEEEEHTPAGDTDRLARFYAREHGESDPGVIKILHFPTPPASREVRLLEVSALLNTADDEGVGVIEFGVARGTPDEHRILVADVTPEQWDAIREGKLSLPDGWDLSEARELSPKRPRQQ